MITKANFGLTLHSRSRGFLHFFSYQTQELFYENGDLRQQNYQSRCLGPFLVAITSTIALSFFPPFLWVPCTSVHCLFKILKAEAAGKWSMVSLGCTVQ